MLGFIIDVCFTICYLEYCVIVISLSVCWRRSDLSITMTYIYLGASVFITCSILATTTAHTSMFGD